MNIWVVKEVLWQKFVANILSKIVEYELLKRNRTLIGDVGEHVRVVYRIENTQLDF